MKVTLKVSHLPGRLRETCCSKPTCVGQNKCSVWLYAGLATPAQITIMVVVPERLSQHAITCLESDYRLGERFLEPKMTWLRLFENVFHFVFKKPVQQDRPGQARGQARGHTLICDYLTVMINTIHANH